MRLVDADALIDIFEDRLEKIRNRYGDYSGEAGVCAGSLHLIREQPTIEERKGKWIREKKHYKDSEQEFYYYEERCSECGTKRKIGWAEVRYCPNCGADMREQP